MLSLEEVKAYGPQYKTVPVSRRMYADIRTPVEVMRILKTVSSQCYLLESMEDSKRWGRYTFLGYDPQMELACKNGTVHIRAGTDIEVQTADPASFLRQVLADNAAPRIDGLPPFTGGLVGYVAYDYIQYAEPSLHLEADDDEDILDGLTERTSIIKRRCWSWSRWSGSSAAAKGPTSLLCGCKAPSSPCFPARNTAAW